MSEGRPLPENISICWLNLGYHVYQAGPCFDTLEQAVTYRDRLDHFGVTWKSKDQSWYELAIETGLPMPFLRLGKCKERKNG